MEKPVQTTAHAKVRKLTVCNKNVPRETLQNGFGKTYIDLPIISLCGKWLQQNGFRGGHTIDVACEHGKLTITLSEKQRFKEV